MKNSGGSVAVSKAGTFNWREPSQVATEADLANVDVASRAPLGWRITGVCAFVALLETTATGMVGGALSSIQETFNLSDTKAGFIPTVAIAGSLVVAVISARLADNARRVSVLAGGAVLWSIAALASPWAPVFVLFLLSRAVLGATGQLNNPAAASLIADAHPASGRSKAYGFERMANYIGLPLGIGLGGALSNSLGWRTAFTVMALPGLVAAFFALRTTEPPRGLGDLLDKVRRHQSDDIDEGPVRADAARVMAAANQAPAVAPSQSIPAPSPSISERVGALWAIRTYRSILVGLPVLFFGLGALFFWSTKYFEETHGMKEDAAGGISGGVGGTGIMIGIIIGSRYGDRSQGRAKGWRLALAAMGLFGGAASFALMVAVPGVAAQAVFYGLANVGIAIAIPNLTAAVADVIPAAMRGASFSTLQFCLALGTAIGPPLVGAASDLFGSLRPALALLVLPLAVAAVIVRRGASTYDGDAALVIASAGG